MVKIKVFIKGEFKSAWGISIFLVKGTVFGQIVNYFLINIGMSRVFKDFVRLFS